MYDWHHQSHDFNMLILYNKHRCIKEHEAITYLLHTWSLISIKPSAHFLLLNTITKRRATWQADDHDYNYLLLHVSCCSLNALDIHHHKLYYMSCALKIHCHKLYSMSCVMDIHCRKLYYIYIRLYLERQKQ